MPAPSALLDECLDPALVPALTQRGFDVVSLLTIGPRGISDTRLLERATELGRVVVTQNADHFKLVHTAWLQKAKTHLGILCLPQRGPLQRRVLGAAMLLDWLGTQEHSSRLFVWGELQARLDRGLRLPGYTEEDVHEALGRA